MTRRTARRFDVAGRGELHLSILLENMRREGYELAVGRPRVVIKTIAASPASRTKC
jgi:predicted membrane GTPase involved in stress response